MRGERRRGCRRRRRRRRRGRGGALALVHAHSSRLRVAGDEAGGDAVAGAEGGADPPRLRARADVIVAELVDSGLLGERIVATLRDAAARLLAPGGAVVPRGARVTCALVAAPALRRRCEVPRARARRRVERVDAPRGRALRRDRRALHVRGLARFAHDRLTAPAAALDVAFASPPPGAWRRVALDAVADGVADAVAVWWTLALDARGHAVSTATGAPAATTHGWAQALYWTPRVRVRRDASGGAAPALRATWRDDALLFELEGELAADDDDEADDERDGDVPSPDARPNARRSARATSSRSTTARRRTRSRARDRRRDRRAREPPLGVLDLSAGFGVTRSRRGGRGTAEPALNGTAARAPLSRAPTRAPRARIRRARLRARSARPPRPATGSTRRACRCACSAARSASTRRDLARRRARRG